jgi:import receptor subunit TOM20
VAALDPDLQGAGTHCSHCLRLVDADTLVRAEGDPFSSVYCSESCKIKAKAQYQTLLFSSGSALPKELEDDESVDTSPASLGARAAAQAKFAAFLKGEAREKGVPLLLARFIARQVGIETVKMLPTGAGVNAAYTEDLPATDLGPGGPEYSLWDHIERLRYLDMQVPDEEHDMMVEVLRTALPGLETFLTDDKHAMLKGKIAYNTIGVCYPPSANGSTDDVCDSKNYPYRLLNSIL